jgi:hypothetical protein
MELEEKVKALAQEGKIPCAALLRLAAELKISPAELGALANKIQLKIAHCQLGCFK